MKQRKLSQNKMAKQLGISKGYLSMILSGQRKPNDELANKLRLGLFTSEAMRLLHTQKVTGSSPVLPTTDFIYFPAKAERVVRLSNTTCLAQCFHLQFRWGAHRTC